MRLHTSTDFEGDAIPSGPHPEPCAQGSTLSNQTETHIQSQRWDCIQVLV